MAYGFDDVAAAGFALAANHRRAFRDAAQRFAQVLRAADERHRKLVLIDLILVVGGRQHFRFVDIVDAERFQALRFREVADAGLGHHRNRHGVHDSPHEREIAHARDAARRANVGRYALERHDCDGAGLLGDRGLLRGHDVHDDAALEHLGEATFDGDGARLRGGVGVTVGSVVHGRELQLESEGWT